MAITPSASRIVALFGPAVERSRRRGIGPRRARKVVATWIGGTTAFGDGIDMPQSPLGARLRFRVTGRVVSDHRLRAGAALQAEPDPGASASRGAQYRRALSRVHRRAAGEERPSTLPPRSVAKDVHEPDQHLRSARTRSPAGRPPATRGVNPAPPPSDLRRRRAARMGEDLVSPGAVERHRPQRRRRPRRPARAAPPWRWPCRALSRTMIVSR